MQRKSRSRPSQEQTEELKKFYELKPHPSKEEREALGVKIGMYVLSHPVVIRCCIWKSEN